MTQAHTLSNSGMFTQFKLTRVLRTHDLDFNNLRIALSVVQPDAVFEDQALAIVDKSQQVNGGRIMQVNILKGVLVSDSLYQASLLLFPAVVPFINETRLSDDYFIPDDKFTQALSKIAPTQTRKTTTMIVGAGGIVDVGVPFVDATVISSIPFTLTTGSAGTITYPLLNVGDTVTISYVTQAIHPTLLITRQETQTVTPSLIINNTVQGVVMNPTLAGLLGITLPPY